MNGLIEAGSFEIETVKVTQSGNYQVPKVVNGQIVGFEKRFYEADQDY
jgi:hypothetical protein